MRTIDNPGDNEPRDLLRALAESIVRARLTREAREAKADDDEKGDLLDGE